MYIAPRSVQFLFPIGYLFINYIISTSCSEGIYGTLRGFVGELGNVMTEVASGIEKVTKGIRHVEEFLDATVDEDCYFECQPGQIALPTEGHEPTANGCGSFGFEDYINTISMDGLPMTEFIECCNTHDICYETCGNDKDECDLKFKKCLYRYCTSIKQTVNKLKHRGCQAGAKILYSGTTMLGCKPYIDAQQNSCTCTPLRDEF